MGINYFTFAGKSSTDFGVWIGGESTYKTPNRDIETIAVAGRDGTLSFDNGRFENIDITYPAFIVDNFDVNFGALKAYLFSKRGYQRLQDTYHPEYFRKARYNSTIEPEMTQLNRHGKFNLTFDCDPRRFLVSGETPIDFTEDGAIMNFTLYDAKPLIRVYGTGTFGIGDTTITITEANEYTDIDCDLMDAYKGSTNCNSNIVLNSGSFPTLPNGESGVTLDGITSLTIYPRFYTI